MLGDNKVCMEAGVGEITVRGWPQYFKNYKGLGMVWEILFRVEMMMGWVSI